MRYIPLTAGTPPNGSYVSVMAKGPDDKTTQFFELYYRDGKWFSFSLGEGKEQEFTKSWTPVEWSFVHEKSQEKRFHDLMRLQEAVGNFIREGCIPDNRAWPNGRENAVQALLSTYRESLR